MLKSSSLYYAIVIMLLSGILLSSILFIENYFFQIINIHYNSDKLIDFNKSSINYSLEYFNSIDTTYSKFEPFNNNSISLIKRMDWGYLDVLYCTSIYKKDTINRIGIVENYDKDKFALFLKDNNIPLSMNNCIIKGNIKLPDAMFKQLYLTRENNGKNLIRGKILSSEKFMFKAKTFKLPKVINDTLFFDRLENKVEIYNDFKNKPIFIVLKKKHKLKNLIIKGKCIIKAVDSIIIYPTASLEDVIIISPKIIIKDNFKGSLQFFAKKDLIVGNNVQLKNPSVLLNFCDADRKLNVLQIGKNCNIEGGIILNDNSFGKNSIMKIDKNTLITGKIYCNSALFFKGNIKGSIYTNKFIYDNGEMKFDNALKDITIDNTKKINSIILKENVSAGYYKIIKWL